MRRPLTVLLMSVAWPLAAQAEPAIRAVTLSTAGLALIEAEATLDADGLHLPVRRADIDDMLKSLRLADPAGAVPKLTMTGPGGLEDAFAALPFTAAQLTDLRALIGAMTGAPVLAERRGQVISGTLMGSRDAPCAQDGSQGCAVLTLRDRDGRLRQLALDEALELTFMDAADREAMARGLDALRAQSRTQIIDLRLTSSDDSPRDIGLGWLQAAPVWQTAWRIEDGPDGLELTGWAVIENATGQDWQDISLTLATGAVQALQVQLFDRVQADRAQPLPIFEPMLSDAPMMRAQALEMTAAPAAVTMEDGASFSRFTLDVPVSLRSGEMLSLPFLQDQLDDARLTLFHGGRGAQHPMIAVEITNPLPLRLPAGIVTLFEVGRGHAGDAMMPELAPGARTIIEFARDTALEIREDKTQDSRIAAARLVDGVLVAEERRERRSTYRISGAAEGDRLLALAHPVTPGWDMLTEGGTTDLTHTRFEVSVPQGQITEFIVTEARIDQTRVALLDSDADTLAFWSGAVPDAALQALLRSLQDLRAEQTTLSRDIARIDAQEARLVAEQARLVDLIVQLGDDTAANRDRRARVDALDAALADAAQRRDAAETRLQALDAELRATLRDP